MLPLLKFYDQLRSSGALKIHLAASVIGFSGSFGFQPGLDGALNEVLYQGLKMRDIDFEVCGDDSISFERPYHWHQSNLAAEVWVKEIKPGFYSGINREVSPGIEMNSWKRAKDILLKKWMEVELFLVDEDQARSVLPERIEEYARLVERLKNSPEESLVFFMDGRSELFVKVHSLRFYIRAVLTNFEILSDNNPHARDWRQRFENLNEDLLSLASLFRIPEGTKVVLPIDSYKGKDGHYVRKRIGNLLWKSRSGELSPRIALLQKSWDHDLYRPYNRNAETASSVISFAACRTTGDRIEWRYGWYEIQGNPLNDMVWVEDLFPAGRLSLKTNSTEILPN